MCVIVYMWLYIYTCHTHIYIYIYIYNNEFVVNHLAKKPSKLAEHPKKNMRQLQLQTIVFVGRPVCRSEVKEG